MGNTAIKTVRERKYLYYIYYSNGKKKEKYCGLANKPESKRKATEFELEELQELQRSISFRISKITTKLGKAK